MKHSLLTAVCLGVAALISTQAVAAVWVKTSESEYNSNTDFYKDYMTVHYVDVSSITTHIGVTYFKRKVDHWRIKNGDWVLTGRYGDDSDHADKMICDKGMLMISGPNSKGKWEYRQANGEWWNEKEIQEGKRYVMRDLLAKHMGYMTGHEVNRHSDRTDEGWFRVVCGSGY